MGFWENFPYTNFHNLNLDWVVGTVKRLEDSVTEAVRLLNETTEKIDEEFKSSIDERFNNLVDSGYFDAIVGKLIPKRPIYINSTSVFAETSVEQDGYVILLTKNGAVGIYAADNVYKDNSFVSKNGVYCNLIAGNSMPELFGAKGDGLADDGDAIVKCCAFFGELRLNGVYKTSVGFEVPTIYGGYSTILREEWQDGAVLISNRGTDVYYDNIDIVIHDAVPGTVIRAVQGGNITLKNVNIKRDGDSVNAAGAWCAMLGGRVVRVQDCTINSVSGGETCDGIHVLEGDEVYITGCDIRAGDDAIAILNQDLGGEVVSYGAINHTVISDCYISSPGFSGIKSGSRLDSVDYPVGDIYINNCVFENCKTIQVHEEYRAEAPVIGIHYNNCLFTGVTTTLAAIQSSKTANMELYCNSCKVRNISNGFIHVNNIIKTVLDNCDIICSKVFTGLKAGMVGYVRNCNIETTDLAKNDGTRFFITNNTLKNTGTSGSIVYRDSKSTDIVVAAFNVLYGTKVVNLLGNNCQNVNNVTITE